MEMRQPAHDCAARSTATNHGDSHCIPQQLGDDRMHLVLLGLHETLQRLATLNQKLHRELGLASGHVAPQPEETLRMRCKLCSKGRVREFALKECLLPVLHCRRTQFPRHAHAALTDSSTLSVA